MKISLTLGLVLSLAVFASVKSDDIMTLDGLGALEETGDAGDTELIATFGGVKGSDIPKLEDLEGDININTNESFLLDEHIEDPENTKVQEGDGNNEIPEAICKKMIGDEHQDEEDAEEEEDKEAEDKRRQVSPARKLFRFKRRFGRCGVQDPDLKDDAVSIFNLPKRLRKTAVSIVILRFCFSSQRSYEYYQAIISSLTIRIKKETNKTKRTLLKLQLKELRAESKRVERSVSVRSFKKQMKIDADQHARQMAIDLVKRPNGLDRNAVLRMTKDKNFVRRLTRVAEQDERMHELARDMVKCQRKLSRKNLGKAEREVFNMVREGVNYQMRAVKKAIRKESAVFKKVLGRNGYKIFRKRTSFVKHVVKVVKTKKVVKRKRVVRRG